MIPMLGSSTNINDALFDDQYNNNLALKGLTNIVAQNIN
jgi:hypothetical protein